MEALPLRESASILCHLRLTNSLFLTADEGRLTQINADELDRFQLYGI
jgi:hypothetical protein